MISEWINPNWNDAGKIRDWRNHVMENVQNIWHTFSDTQKEELFKQAYELASREEWE